jgi:hypothetical protein
MPFGIRRPPAELALTRRLTAEGGQSLARFLGLAAPLLIIIGFVVTVVIIAGD